MGKIVLSSYSTPAKALIVGGVLFFFAVGGLVLRHGLTDAPTNDALAISLALAAGLGGVGWFGLRLIPFINFSCTATPEGLYVFDRKSRETFIPWSSVSRVKDWPVLQVLDIYDLEGKRVLSIDHLISNFDAFHAQLQESLLASR